MSSQLVGSAEAFSAARKGASMWLLSGMGSNMSGLMFQAVEGFVAQRTFVRSREILSSIVGDSIE